MSFIGAIDKSMIKAATNYGPLDDRSYYPGGSFYGGYSPASSGIAVSSETAMRLITVQNCVRQRAMTISQLPCHIMEKSGKTITRAEDFYLYEKLHDQPNSWMTASTFWGMLEAHICLYGNFYVFKLGLSDRPILELVPLSAGVVQKVTQNEDYSISYEVRLRNGQTGTYGQDKIWHIRGLTLNGLTGMNPIEAARETIGIGMAGDRFIGQYFGKGLHPSAVIKHPLSLNATTHANMRAALKEKYATLANSFDFMLLDENMTIEFPQIKLVDAQYLELMKMNEAQICGMFRVPLMLIQSGDKTPTFASAEQFDINYVKHGVAPDCVNYEKSIRHGLLTDPEKKKYYAKFNLNSLLRGDFKTRMEGYAIGIDKEIFNPNEIRELEEYNSYEGGERYATRTSTTKETTGNNKEGAGK